MLSLTNEMPISTLFAMGECAKKVAVFGAPTAPTHCVLYNPPMFSMPSLSVAYPGLITLILYIYCVNCGSCWAFTEEDSKKAAIKITYFISIFLIFFMLPA